MGRLLSPCLCTGSMRFVHARCLTEWRTASSNPRSFYQCDSCQYRYNIARTKWAAILESAPLARLLSALLLLGLWGVSALLVAACSIERYFYRMLEFDPREPKDAGVWLADLWGSKLDMLVAGVLGVASGGLVLSVRRAYAANRHVNHGWLMAIGSTFAANGLRATRLFMAAGLVHSVYAAVQQVEAWAKELLAKFGTTVLEVRR